MVTPLVRGDYKTSAAWREHSCNNQNVRSRSIARACQPIVTCAARQHSQRLAIPITNTSSCTMFVMSSVPSIRRTQGGPPFQFHNTLRDRQQGLSKMSPSLRSSTRNPA